jgi:hypothetical protein
MTTYRHGEPEPEPPLCELCGQQHWPAEHQVVCEVFVRTREEAQRWQQAGPDGLRAGETGDRPG